MFFILIASACGANSTATHTPTPVTPTETPGLFERTPQTTRDPNQGPPTLPPEYTATSTPTESATPTATATFTATMTPGIDAICEALVFPKMSIDGVTFTQGADGSPLIIGIYQPNTALVWILKNLDTGEEIVQPIDGNTPIAFIPSTLVTPGRYEWTVFVSTPTYERICEETVTFTLLPDPDRPTATATAMVIATATPDTLPPSLLEQILENLLKTVRENRRRNAETMTPTP